MRADSLRIDSDARCANNHAVEGKFEERIDENAILPELGGFRQPSGSLESFWNISTRTVRNDRQGSR
jgi:hypothetical protein